MSIGNRLEAIDPYASMHIQHKVKQLIRRGKFPAHMADDLAQEIAMDYLQRRPAYDPARSSRETFTVRVVSNKIASLLRARRAQGRDVRREECSLDELVDSGEGVPAARHETVDAQVGRDGRRSEELHHLTRDVHEVLGSLPDDLRTLCVQLQSMTVSEISRATGISRPAIYESIRKLRQRFSAAGLDDYLSRG